MADQFDASWRDADRRDHCRGTPRSLPRNAPGHSADGLRFIRGQSPPSVLLRCGRPVFTGAPDADGAAPGLVQAVATKTQRTEPQRTLRTPSFCHRDTKNTKFVIFVIFVTSVAGSPCSQWRQALRARLESISDFANGLDEGRVVGVGLYFRAQRGDTAID